MDIAVELYGMWRDIAGSRSVIVTLESGSTLNDLVCDLASRYGEDFRKLLVNPATGELWSTFAVDRTGACFLVGSFQDELSLADTLLTSWGSRDFFLARLGR